MPLTIVIRVDASPQIGGGHMMRCLTLAAAARDRGHDVHFVMARSMSNGRVRAAGFSLTELEPRDHQPEATPTHAHWLSLPWREDAAYTAEHRADWVVLDHYGLDGRWISELRKANPTLRVLALDDLDDRALGADLVLDPARGPSVRRAMPVLGTLDGPDYALLRPEFKRARPAALARRSAHARRVIVTPGLFDAAGLAPKALAALDDFDVDVELVMGGASQSLAEVREMVSARPRASVTIDVTDMAARMATADLCIGAGGGTSWERCALGLPTVAVAVAENQKPGIAMLTDAGAVIAADMHDDLAAKIAEALARLPELSKRAAALCDGQGANRVVDALDAKLRPLAERDAQQLFDWRNQPHIRAVSHDKAPLVWDAHVDWIKHTLQRSDGVWRVYQEGERDLGFVSAVLADRVWRWSFYIGQKIALRGAGGRMLSAMIRELRVDGRGECLEGEVLQGNVASERLHRRLGFDTVEQDKSGVLVFRRAL